MSFPSKIANPAQPKRNVSHGDVKSSFHLLPADTFYRAATRPTAPANGELLPMVIHATKADVGILFELNFDNSTKDNSPILNRQKIDWQGSEKVASVMGPETEKLAVQAVADGKPVWRFVKSDAGKFLGVAVPIQLEDDRCLCLVVVISEARPAQGQSIAAVLQGYGNWFFFVDVARQNWKKSWVFDNVAAMIELTGLCAAADDVKGATGLMADHLQQLMRCSTVAIVVKKRGRFELASISGGLDLEQRSEGTTMLEAAVAEAAKRKQSIVHNPGESTGNEILTGAIYEAARTFGAKGWLVAPLERDTEVAGGWVFFWNNDDPDFAEKTQLLTAANRQVAPLLAFIQRGKPDGFRALIGRVWRRLKSDQRRLVWGIAAVALAVAVFPAKERIATTCELQPSVRRIVAAPFDGTLRKSIAEAGEVVETGQILAEIDGREIRFQLAEVVANRARAVKEADQAMDSGKVAESQMAELEARSYEQQQLLLEERKTNLEIKAPIAGLILQGDLERAEGAPLRMGDRMFEIAPTDKMIVEFEVPESEISFVKAGMAARFKLDAHPGHTFKVMVESVAPRSEIRGESNVFICEATIENTDGILHPGMKGNGKILAARRPLIWSAIRPAVNWVRLKFWL